ncbi:hypothetical protein M0Q50_08465 [bacterium]|jgi:hypothetical protein|nr:hypothetical protein [bacterium]
MYDELTTWTKKDGTEVLLTDMTLQHINLCIAMLKKSKWYSFGIHDDWINAFNMELKNRILSTRKKKLESL